MTYLLLSIGLLGLFLGGELLVRGAVGIARRFGLSPLVIGLTVVGFGTSTPELLVSLQAALDGTPAISIGNVVGSNIANILLILGVSALIAPLAMAWAGLKRDMVVMIAATIALGAMMIGGVLGRAEGALMLGALALYLWAAMRQGGAGAEDQDESPVPPLWKSAAFTLAGLVGLMIAARLLIDAATTIARDFGISEAVIGLTIVAVGTSLPELATSVVAAIRRQTEIAVGNVVGSNIFNILGILGMTALITPVPVDARFLWVDMPVALAVAALLALAAWRWGRLSRWGGAGMLAAYGAYVAAMAAA